MVGIIKNNIIRPFGFKDAFRCSDLELMEEILKTEEINFDKYMYKACMSKNYPVAEFLFGKIHDNINARFYFFCAFRDLKLVKFCAGVSNIHKGLKIAKSYNFDDKIIYLEKIIKKNK